MTDKERMQDFVGLLKSYDDEYRFSHTADSGVMDLIIRNQPLQGYLAREGFFTAPASTKYHGAYEGGLYDHSRAVAARLVELTKNNNLKWQRPASPVIIGFFHDLCKCDQYIKTETGYEYNANTLLKGHGAKSVMILSQYLNLTEEEMLCIRYHMGAYEKEEWSEFDQAIRKYGNTLWVHMSDMLASKIDGI